MSDTTPNLDQLATGQANLPLRINELLDAASPATVYARRAATTSGLTWGYYGGRWGSNSVPNGVLSLTASADNYITINRSTGAVSVATNTTAWNNTVSHARAYKVTTGTATVTTYEDHRAGAGGSAGGGSASSAVLTAIPVAVSDETTALTAGVSKVTFRMPFAFALSAVRASLTTAPTGAALVVDINQAGASILSTKLSIDATEKTSTTAATAAVISDTTLDDDAEITIDIDQVGSTVAGAGLKVYLIGAAS